MMSLKLDYIYLCRAHSFRFSNLKLWIALLLPIIFSNVASADRWTQEHIENSTHETCSNWKDTERNKSSLAKLSVNEDMYFYLIEMTKELNSIGEGSLTRFSKDGSAYIRFRMSPGFRTAVRRCFPDNIGLQKSFESALFDPMVQTAKNRPAVQLLASAAAFALVPWAQIFRLPTHIQRSARILMIASTPIVATAAILHFLHVTEVSRKLCEDQHESSQLICERKNFKNTLGTLIDKEIDIVKVIAPAQKFLDEKIRELESNRTRIQSELASRNLSESEEHSLRTLLSGTENNLRFYLKARKIMDIKQLEQ